MIVCEKDMSVMTMNYAYKILREAEGSKRGK